MRMQIKLAVAAMAVGVGFVSAGVASAQQGSYIVNSQVVSDEVVGGSGIGGAVVSDGSGEVCENCQAGTVGQRGYGRPDLFYNNYTQGHGNSVNAQMYVAPLPVPAHVGHTYYTYQPFMPQEMLYAHKDKFHNYYDNGRGLNRTKATYYYPPVRQTASNFYWNVLRIPR